MDPTSRFARGVSRRCRPPRREGDRSGAGQLAARTLTYTNAQDVAALARTVDAGESEAIVLAAEHGLILVIDDLAGRRAAAARGVTIIGSAGILGLAKAAGLLPVVQPPLDELLDLGLRLSASLYRQILADAGEA